MNVARGLVLLSALFCTLTTARADDILYAYCAPEADHGLLDTIGLALLAFNFHTAEEVLYIRTSGDSFEWFAGRNANESPNFQTRGDYQELQLALALRRALQQQEFHFVRTTGTADSYPQRSPETCTAEWID